jgi:hypothetical protein
MGLRLEVSDGHVVLIRNIVVHDGRRRRSWALGSRTRRAVHGDDRLRVFLRLQKHCNDTPSTRNRLTSPASTWRLVDRRHSMRLLFVKWHAISTWISAWYDRTSSSSRYIIWPWRDVLHAPSPARGRMNGKDQDSWSRIGVHRAIDKQHTTTSAGTCSSPNRTTQHLHSR